MNKTQIEISFSYEGNSFEYSYLCPCVVESDDLIQLIAEGLLFEANWAGDSVFEDYTVTTSIVNETEDVEVL